MALTVQEQYRRLEKTNVKSGTNFYKQNSAQKRQHLIIFVLSSFLNAVLIDVLVIRTQY